MFLTTVSTQKGCRKIKYQWRVVEDFPMYLVSELGEVMNSVTDHIKQPNFNQAGHATVLLMRDGRGSRVSVARLVAETFLPVPERDDFNTVIHLNGDFADCRAENLAWRPRWFAVRYHRQFDGYRRLGAIGAIEDVETGEIYESTWEAAQKHGLLDTQIMVCMTNNTYVFPTGQMFRWVK